MALLIETHVQVRLKKYLGLQAQMERARRFPLVLRGAEGRGVAVKAAARAEGDVTLRQGRLRQLEGARLQHS
jgi:hypothetical protein